MEDDVALPCADKLVFDDEKSARTAAIVADWQHTTKPGLKPYKCRYCGLWHLATKEVE